MLFNSYIFILVFLPVTLFVFHALHNFGRHRLAFAALATASLIFYGWWSVRALGLLLILMAANYAVVFALLANSALRDSLRRGIVALAIAGNLAVLGYFKYANFFLENWAALRGTQWSYITVILPLGLSFFTFQKIALIVDAYRGKVSNFEPLGYVLFVSFFPQLIAGPIVHHSEVMPQFAKAEAVGGRLVAAGISLFVIGLAKKVLIADNVAQWVTPIFESASAGHLPSSTDAWVATTAYSLQLYFDFSGYTDMAIGLALLFGIRLPLNFNSPYKAANITEFWRCWHMTLSRFLRDYLYIPLGGNRRGPWRRYLNLAITMLLGGLWHGAAWTFVIWGGLHAVYLGINHAWIALRKRTRWTGSTHPLWHLTGCAITFLAVLIAWVFFRAADVGTAISILKAMVGFGNAAVSTSNVILAIAAIVTLLAIVWLAPNSIEIVGYLHDAPKGRNARLALWGWAPICGFLLALSLMSLTRMSEFLYFQF
jgi:D-alanyl-lipoteichoic acid acyltransferase DltB (MBOAT superfamily)